MAKRKLSIVNRPSKQRPSKQRSVEREVADADFKNVRFIVRSGFVVAIVVAACLEVLSPIGKYAFADSDVGRDDTGTNPLLEAPDKQLIPKIKIADAVGWRNGAKPVVASGFSVNAFAEKLDHPRWLYVLPNGDVLVAETNAPEGRNNRKGLRGWFMKKAMQRAGAATKSANRITLLRDADHDGNAETSTVFVSNLNSPFGMALVGSDLYVANTDAVLKYRYTDGATTLEGSGEKIAALPAGSINHHWTKNIIASPDGKKLYATVGSNSNVGENGMENEKDRAAILEIDLQTRGTRLFASGLRNPNGLAWNPATGELWTSVNERDEIGDRLVPDYITAVHDGEFFGWPYSYYGTHPDARAPKEGSGSTQVFVPDYAVGSHTASLGLVFYEADLDAHYKFPPRYHGGAFVGQHGSWNRSSFAGYKVVFVPFDGAGHAQGPIEEFLIGFLDNEGRAQGRPVGVVVDGGGALLVADDVGNKVWRVIPSQAAATSVSSISH